MGRKRRRQRNIFLVGLGLGLFALIFSVVENQNLLSGNFGIMITYIFDYFPHLLGISLGFVLLVKDKGNYSTTPIRLMLITSVIGMVFASLFYEMNVDGIWIDEIVTATYTITEFQFTIVLFFFLLGCLLGLLKRR